MSRLHCGLDDLCWVVAVWPNDLPTEQNVWQDTRQSSNYPANDKVWRARHKPGPLNSDYSSDNWGFTSVWNNISAWFLKANPVHRPHPEAPFDAPYMDSINSPPDTDVYWDASDLIDRQETSLNFGLSTSSYTESWANSSNTDLLSWSPNSSYLTAQDSIRGSISGTGNTTEAPLDALSMTTISAISDLNFQVDTKDIPLPAPHNCPLQQYPSLSYPSPTGRLSTQIPAPAGHTEQTLACSEDPFMGWASKKSGQMFDEYNWVLSHVEIL